MLLGRPFPGLARERVLVDQGETPRPRVRPDHADHHDALGHEVQNDGMEQFGPEPIETAKLVWAEAYAIEHCDALLSPTRYMLDWLSQNGVRAPGSVFVTPNPYTENTEQEAASREVDNDHLVFFGRLQHRKSLHVLGDALRQLKREGGPLPQTVSFLGTHFRVNGQPSEEYLAQLHQDLAPIEFRVVNNLDHLGARAYIERTRGLVVIPSLVENCPYVVIECIANRLPFLAARTGGIPDMVDPRATFEPTPAALAARLADRHRIGHGDMRHPYSVRDAARIWLELHGEEGPFGGGSGGPRGTSATRRACRSASSSSSTTAISRDSSRRSRTRAIPTSKSSW
jgi:O-antigen biosynthesis protein